MIKYNADRLYINRYNIYFGKENFYMTKEKAVAVPEKISECVKLETEEVAQLYKTLY